MWSARLPTPPFAISVTFISQIATCRSSRARGRRQFRPPSENRAVVSQRPVRTKLVQWRGSFAAIVLGGVAVGIGHPAGDGSNGRSGGAGRFTCNALETPLLA